MGLKKTRRSNKELKDLSSAFLFKILSKKIELQYKLIKVQSSVLFASKEKKKPIDLSNYLDDLKKENEAAIKKKKEKYSKWFFDYHK